MMLFYLFFVWVILVKTTKLSKYLFSIWVEKKKNAFNYFTRGRVQFMYFMFCEQLKFVD